MRKSVFFLLALPLMAIAQDKNVISYDRVFPKPGKTQQFEKALAAHVQKYHKGDNSWRVYTIESGPDVGGYNIIEGPTTWDGVDKRGNLGAAHTADYDTNILPLLTDKSMTGYATYRADLSTEQIANYTGKIAVTHIFPKPGYADEMDDMFGKLKKTWEASGQTAAVYELSSSGEPQYVVVISYKEGLKERATGYRKPMKERYNGANGDGSWATYQQGLRTMIDHSWSELLFYKPELGSK